jgi:hypothetical protein
MAVEDVPNQKFWGNCRENPNPFPSRPLGSIKGVSSDPAPKRPLLNLIHSSFRLVNEMTARGEDKIQQISHIPRSAETDLNPLALFHETEDNYSRHDHGRQTYSSLDAANE